MTTIVKFAIAITLSILFVSCAWDTGVKGNGNVTTTARDVSASFTEIEVSRGLDVYITQANNNAILVEADDNLQNLITTTVNRGVLNISTSQNIGTSKSKKVLVDAKTVEFISSSSGSDIYTNNTIESKTLHLKTSSGANLELDIVTQNLKCSASSGSGIELSGKTTNLTANASSGSNIKAKHLIAQNGKVNASSGADVTVNVTEKLSSKSNSGGNVRNLGNN